MPHCQFRQFLSGNKNKAFDPAFVTPHLKFSDDVSGLEIHGSSQRRIGRN